MALSLRHLSCPLSPMPACVISRQPRLPPSPPPGTTPVRGLIPRVPGDSTARSSVAEDECRIERDSARIPAKGQYNMEAPSGIAIEVKSTGAARTPCRGDRAVLGTCFATQRSVHDRGGFRLFLRDPREIQADQHASFSEYIPSHAGALSARLSVGSGPPTPAAADPGFWSPPRFPRNLRRM